MRVLGFDTSNYTTSVAVVCEEDYKSRRQILTVKEGERGLRQSDALFLHIQNLPALLDELEVGKIDAVAYSLRPRDAEGSYMPCFCAGVTAAKAAAKAAGVPCLPFSHQAGHIMAALRSSGKEEEIGREFLAFHLSGGTTELLHVCRCPEKGFDVTLIGKTLDISAGQLIDRAGVLLGLRFPCGNELEKLAEAGTLPEKPHICVREGCCNLSGAENKIIQMCKNENNPADIAFFTLSFVSETVLAMCRFAREKYPALPLVAAGGVMRNRALKNAVATGIGNAFFAEPDLSSDNAVGTAYLGLEAMKGML